MIGYLKPYPAYKESGVPWLGQVPEHWAVERAKWLFRKMERPVRDDDKVVTCFRDGTVTLRHNRRARGFTESLKEIGYQGIRKGDLVIHAMDAFAGAVGVADCSGKGTPVYSVCEPTSHANAYYYAYAIREMARSQWIQALAKGIRERSTDFRFSDFCSQQISLPPLEEQAAIVHFLDYMDRRIRHYVRARQKLIKLLEEKKQAIIHLAVTRGLDPDVRLKPSGVEWLGEIPEHWEVRRAKYLFREVDRRSTTGTEVLLSLRMHKGLTPHNEVSGIPITAQALIGFKKVQQGQIVMNRMRAAIGMFGIASRPGLVSPDYAVFDTSTSVDGEYFLLLFKTPAAGVIFRIESKGLGTGSSGFMRLYTDRFGMIKLPLPPQEEQRRIVQCITKSTQEIEHTKECVNHQIALLREYRALLIANVVSGKLDVRSAATNLPDEAEEPEPMDEADEVAEDEDEVAEADLGQDAEEDAA